MRTPTTDDQKPRYPQNYAFVIQFQHPRRAGDPDSGRVEHIATGRAGRFDSPAQLMAFVAEVLGCEDDARPAQPSETSRATS